MTKKIPLSQGHVAVVDEVDYERVARYRWTVMKQKKKDGYRFYARRNYKRGGKQQTEYLHRFVLGAAPGQLVDHVNGDGLNNSRSNLRIATPSRNTANSTRNVGQSGYRGVWRREKDNCYEAGIRVSGRWKYLGQFNDAAAAAKAYDAAAREYFGDFAHLNFAITAGLGVTTGPAFLARAWA